MGVMGIFLVIAGERGDTGSVGRSLVDFCAGPCAAMDGCERGTTGNGCERVRGGCDGNEPERRDGNLSEGCIIPRMGRRGWLFNRLSSSSLFVARILASEALVLLWIE